MGQDRVDATESTKRTTNGRREALQRLTEVLELSPDIRLGQFMAHLGLLAEAHLDRGLGVIEDGELLTILEKHRQELLARRQGADESL